MRTSIPEKFDPMEFAEETCKGCGRTIPHYEPTLECGHPDCGDPRGCKECLNRCSECERTICELHTVDLDDESFCIKCADKLMAQEAA